MDFHEKIPKNGKKIMFRDNQRTNMLPMALLGVKVLSET